HVAPARGASSRTSPAGERTHGHRTEHVRREVRLAQARIREAIRSETSPRPCCPRRWVAAGERGSSPASCRPSWVRGRRQSVARWARSTEVTISEPRGRISRALARAGVGPLDVYYQRDPHVQPQSLSIEW